MSTVSLVISALDGGRWLVGLDMHRVLGVSQGSDESSSDSATVDLAAHLGVTRRPVEPRRALVEAAGQRFTVLLGEVASIVSVPVASLFQAPALVAPSMREAGLIGLFVPPSEVPDFGFVVDLERLAQGLPA